MLFTLPVGNHLRTIYQVLAMSTRALNAFTEQQKEAIGRCVHKIVHADISTIEDVGGGGVRCTLAELF
jgi:hypothetical protein